MTRDPLIYGLFDPRNGELRYVGKASNGVARCASHVTPSSLRAVTLKNGWLKSLLKIGLRPDIDVLERHVSPADLDESERHWIASMRSLGCRLTNMTAGGDGQVGVAFTAEHRAKLSAALRGKRTSVRSAANYAAAAAKRRGSAMPRAAVESAAAKRRGSSHSPESLARMSVAQLAKAQAPGYREKLSRAHGGRPFVDHLERRYETIQGAAREIGISASKICRVLKGELPFTSGFTFRFTT